MIHVWKIDKWTPERLASLYKCVGAQDFFALANHHDNLDLYDSEYREWNSLRVGPKRDIVGGWAKAAKANGLPFGVSVHASHAWIWYEASQGADSSQRPRQGRWGHRRPGGESPRRDRHPGWTKESIFGTRPWKTFGEGPASEGVALSVQGFNEGKGKPFTEEDVRYTTRGGVV